MRSSRFGLVGSSCLLILGAGCGNGLPAPGASAAAPGPQIASGASLLLDANDFSGNGSVPASACAATTWSDRSGNGNDGTLTCGTGGFSGAGTTASPYAVAFDGANTRVSTSLSVLPSAMPSTTWVAWVKPTSGAFAHLMSSDNHGGAWNRSLTINSTQWETFMGSPGSFSATAATLNQWQNVAVVFTASDIVLYLNGTPYRYGTAPTFNNTGFDLTIGRSGGGAFDYFTGSVNWVAVYNRALTATEISDTCKALQGRFDSVTCS